MSFLRINKEYSVIGLPENPYMQEEKAFVETLDEISHLLTEAEYEASETTYVFLKKQISQLILEIKTNDSLGAQELLKYFRKNFPAIFNEAVMEITHQAQTSFR